MAGFLDAYFRSGLLPNWPVPNMDPITAQNYAPRSQAGPPVQLSQSPMSAMASVPGQLPAAAPDLIPSGAQPGILDRFSGGLANNSNMLLGMGSQLLSGGGWGGGLQGAMVGGQLDTRQRAANQTKQALVARGVDPRLVDAIVANPTAMGEYLKQSIGISGQTDDIKEFEYAKKQGFTGSLEQWMQRKRAGAGEFGLQPVYGTDAEGKPVVLQLGKSGEAVASKIPSGVNISTGVEKVDLGTQWGMLDKRSGQFVGYIPKDIAGKEVAEARGKAQGQAQVTLPDAIQRAELATKYIDEMISHPGRETATGLSSQLDPRNYLAGTSATDFKTRLEQLKGGAFLEAYKGLRGGGAITEVEGVKAEQAIARMSTAQSDSEFVNSMNEYKGIINLGLNRAKRMAAGDFSGEISAPATAPRATPSVSNKVRTYNPSTGQLE